MKKMALSLFLAALLCVLAACPTTFVDNLTVISGTVTITRNGIPWNNTNFSPYSYSYARDPGPPIDRPIIYAYYKGGGWCGNVSVSYQENSNDYRNGIFQWKLKIPADKLPCDVVFDVHCNMRDVSSGLRSIGKEFRIQDKTTTIDIGHINYDVIRLSGNLPITINNEQPQDYTSRWMEIFKKGSTYRDWMAYIEPDGKWSLNIEQPLSETSVQFQLEVRENGGFLRKMLNADNDITIYDTDKEIVFADYPSVNFEAFRLAGIIEVNLPGTSESRYFNIRFFREGGEFAGNEYSPWSYMLSDTDTGWSASGRKEWKTTIPVLELPHELQYSFTFIKGPYMYEDHSSITLTSDTDLSKLDLGVFTSP